MPPKKKTPAKKAAPPKSAAKKKAPPKKSAKKAVSKPSPKKSVAKPSQKSAPKGSTTTYPYYAQWSWQADNNKLLPFDVRQNQLMEEAYTKSPSATSVQMSYNNWNYSINFDKMIQKNLSTGRERNIARELKKTSAASGGKSKESASGKRQRTVMKGRGVVDALSGKVDSCHVFEQGNCVYQCTLNQTNIKEANNNKFYILQLLEEDDKSAFYLFTRWGRVGVDGQLQTEAFGNNLSAAIAAFKKKFHDKTKNDWDNRDIFVKVAGKYQLMQIDYGANDDDDENNGPAAKKAKKESTTPAATAASSLPAEVQSLMKLIGSKESMVSTMKELAVDTQRMPLGKISKTQIKEAFNILKSIEKELKKAKPDVTQLSEDFYTLIPHNFGFQRAPLINSLPMVKEKSDLLETLGQLEVATKLLDSSAAATGGADAAAAPPKHYLDRTYDSLKCSLTPLNKNSPEYKRVLQYAQNTHGKTHTNYTLTVEDVFRVKRETEDTRYEKKCKNMDNKQMLWHGSRTTNFMGILSQGLRIAPPEAPVTGYMFGKGIYLADVCSKSANYCSTSRTNTTGLMLLCEAALGKQKEYTSATYMEKAPAGHHSTKGVGRMFPDPKGSVTVDGVLWPMGKMTEQKSNTSLLYPEYIVYDVDQCRLQYLVKMRFNYK